MGARFWSRFWFCRSLNLNLDFFGSAGGDSFVDCCFEEEVEI